MRAKQRGCLNWERNENIFLSATTTIKTLNPAFMTIKGYPKTLGDEAYLRMHQYIPIAI